MIAGGDRRGGDAVASADDRGRFHMLPIPEGALVRVELSLLSTVEAPPAAAPMPRPAAALDEEKIVASCSSACGSAVMKDDAAEAGRGTIRPGKRPAGAAADAEELALDRVAAGTAEG